MADVRVRAQGWTLDLERLRVDDAALSAKCDPHPLALRVIPHAEGWLLIDGRAGGRSGGDGAWQGKRFAAVSHLLSLNNNWRLRVRVFAEDDEFPAVDSVTGIWTSVNWFEREAFDLYGIAFVGHDDLRRILTDYGFIGPPFRKDFPICGHVEMRYDPDQARGI